MGPLSMAAKAAVCRPNEGIQAKTKAMRAPEEPKVVASSTLS